MAAANLRKNEIINECRIEREPDSMYNFRVKKTSFQLLKFISLRRADKIQVKLFSFFREKTTAV